MRELQNSAGTGTMADPACAAEVILLASRKTLPTERSPLGEMALEAYSLQRRFAAGRRSPDRAERTIHPLSAENFCITHPELAASSAARIKGAPS